MEAFGVGQILLPAALGLGRGRNAGYPASPAQIPACATNALGSCLRL